MKRKDQILGRRDFLIAAVATSTALLPGCKSTTSSGWEFLSDRAAQTLRVICDQIVPTDDFPSASQAGVLTFIDRQLVRHLRRYREIYSDGLEQANLISRKLFGRDLNEATAEQQFAVVSALEKQNAVFFNLVRNHTFDGYYGAPRHGGNRDAVSWRMLGLTEPPLLGRSQYDLQKESGQ